MCGRFTNTKDKKEIETRFKASTEQTLEIQYNAAPADDLPIITNTFPNKIQKFRWGLIPSWAKDMSFGNKTINARIETITEKPTFKNAFKNQRCIVIADGYYEWQKVVKDKIPYRITLEGEKLFAMAGLWDMWPNENGEIINSFSIITMPAYDKLAKIHHRMPIILEEENEKRWLETTLKQSDLFDVLKPVSESEIKYYTVSKLVNSTSNQSSKLIESYHYNIQGSLF